MFGCGGSGFGDGQGCKAMQFFDHEHRLVAIKGGEDLLKVDYIDTAYLDKRLDSVQIDVACNWNNVLCGEEGVARVFGLPKSIISQ